MQREYKYRSILTLKPGHRSLYVDNDESVSWVFTSATCFNRSLFLTVLMPSSQRNPRGGKTRVKLRMLGQCFCVIWNFFFFFFLQHRLIHKHTRIRLLETLL